jgi:hypothetical protein
MAPDVLTRFLLAGASGLFSVYLAWVAFAALKSGALRTKTGMTLYRCLNPIGFWATAVGSLVAAGIFFGLFVMVIVRAA